MKKNLLTTVLLLSSFYILSQPEPEFLDPNVVIPPSPTAASLNRYITIPISKYTGVPEISIPLYNITIDDFSLPITLSYHASGNKVEDEASWVGLGWSLNAGGGISRSVSNQADDWCKNYGKHYSEVAGWTEHEGSPTTYLEKIYNGTYDNKEHCDLFLAATVGMEGINPDLFFMNFSGNTAKFVFDRQGNIQLMSKKDWVITKTFQSQDNLKIIKFEVTTEDGTTYVFSDLEVTQAQTRNYNLIRLSNGHPWPEITTTPYLYGMSYTEYVSTWHLTQIKTRKNKVIDFTYEDEEVTFARRGCKTSYTEPEYWPGDFNLGENPDFVHIVQTKRLKSIEWPTGKIEFDRTFQREDQKISTNNALSAVTVYRKKLGEMLYEQIKRYELNHSHFISSDIQELSNEYKYVGKRLRLDAIQEFGENSSIFKPPYQFTYNSTPLPSKLSFQQDFWGYYNANNATEYIRPTYVYPDSYIPLLRSRFSIFPLNNYTGAEHAPDFANYTNASAPYGYSNENAMKACVLKEIQYPTGGYVKLYYQAHDFLNPDNIFRTDNNIQVGGLRVWKREYSPDGTQKMSTEFKYVQNDEQGNILLDENQLPLSSGKMISFPQHAHYYNTCYDKEYIRIADPYDPWAPPPGTTPAWDYNVLSYWPEDDHAVKRKWYSHSIQPLETTYGSYIGYTEVREEVEGNGFTISKYSLPGALGVEQEDLINGEYLFKQPDYVACNNHHNIPLDSLDVILPMFKPNYDWRRGHLTEQKDYNEDKILLKKTILDYTIGEDYDIIESIVVGEFKRSIIYCIQYGTVEEHHIGHISADSYYISAWQYLSSKKEYTYNTENPTEYLLTQTEYNHNSPYHHQVTNITTNNSDNTMSEVEIKYPEDLCPTPIENGDIEALGCSRLVDCNLITPIEIIHHKNDKVVDAKLMTYRMVGSQAVYPYQNFYLETTKSLSRIVGNPDEFKPANISNNGTFTKDGHYTNQPIIYEYENNGNLLHQYSERDINKFYVWGYNNLYPVAKIETQDATLNTAAIQSSVNSQSFSNSDGLASVNSDIAKLKSCLTSVLDNSDYMVTYFTYKPLVGITTQTDPSGKTTYYEYDAFGRLETIKDQDGVVIKHTEYNYATCN